MNANLIRFYGSLIFLYFSDMSLLITIMWLSYDITNSPFFLGAMLSISAILPILLKKITNRINILSLSIKDLMKLRVVIYLSLVFISYFIGENIYGLTLLSILAGLLSVTILSSYEAKNIQLVLDKQIDKSYSARIIQTVIQVGAFLGAVIGGFILQSIGFKATILLISSLDITVCLIMYITEKSNVVNNNNSPFTPQIVEMKNKKAIYLLSLLLGLVALHISTFNLTIPIIFQDINHWEITDFGIASGLAGMGALSAVFFKNNIKKLLFLLTIFVAVDFIFTFNKVIELIIPLCFTIGFCMNSIRIFVRETMISLAENTKQTSYIASISTLFYMLFQSLGSVTLGLLIGFISLDYFTQFLLPFIASLILVCFILIYKKEF